MKRLLITALGTAVFMATTAQAAVSLKTEQDKLSYSMGVMTGRAFKSHQIEIDPQTFAAGLTDGYNGGKTQMTDAEIHQSLQNFQKESMKKMEAKMKEMSEANAKKAKAFFADNKNKPGVLALADGLQYKVIEAGKGDSPTAKDTVTVNYEGRLLDGKVFDSSYKRGKPATFPVTGVIKGWQETLVLMKPGATWEIYVPAQLAYGAQGVPGVIGPNEALIFKVNLISVQKKK